MTSSSTTEHLRPQRLDRVKDSVLKAGIEISDWISPTNPKYCYNWSFIDEAKGLVVLNLWHINTFDVGGRFFQRINERKAAAELGRAGKNSQERRAKTLDLALQFAARNSLPIRVIVCDGDMRDIRAEDEKPSSVSARELDPQPWSVVKYDWSTGDCEIVRSSVPVSSIDDAVVADTLASSPNDDFEVQVDALRRRGLQKPSGNVHPATIISTGTTTAIMRSAEVKAWVLQESGGRCECCYGLAPFHNDRGLPFLEVHHLCRLADGGSDTPENAIAICPNCHRELHYGAHRNELMDRVYSTVDRLIKE